jgi:hypothetical protein
MFGTYGSFDCKFVSCNTKGHNVQSGDNLPIKHYAYGSICNVCNSGTHAVSASFLHSIVHSFSSLNFRRSFSSLIFVARFSSLVKSHQS